ncbi:MAG: dTMP kinase [Bacteriovoracaceae bacterium]
MFDQKSVGSYFLSFEGIEGSGKSTQIKNLECYFQSLGFDVLVLREPGGSAFGEKLREALLTSTVALHPMAEAFCFASSRTQLLSEKVLPHLKKEKTVVILDRYMDSSIAYQGIARGLGFETIVKLHDYAPLNQRPDLTLYLKIDLETSQVRQKIRGNEKDYFEKENHLFYQKLIQGYDQCALAFPERISTVDAKQDPDEVFSEIKKICQVKFKL